MEQQLNNKARAVITLIVLCMTTSLGYGQGLAISGSISGICTTDTCKLTLNDCLMSINVTMDTLYVRSSMEVCNNSESRQLVELGLPQLSDHANMFPKRLRDSKGQPCRVQINGERVSNDLFHLSDMYHKYEYLYNCKELYHIYAYNLLTLYEEKVYLENNISYKSYYPRVEFMGQEYGRISHEYEEQVVKPIYETSDSIQDVINSYREELMDRDPFIKEDLSVADLIDNRNYPFFVFRTMFESQEKKQLQLDYYETPVMFLSQETGPKFDTKQLRLYIGYFCNYICSDGLTVRIEICFDNVEPIKKSLKMPNKARCSYSDNKMTISIDASKITPESYIVLNYKER